MKPVIVAVRTTPITSLNKFETQAMYLVPFLKRPWNVNTRIANLTAIDIYRKNLKTVEKLLENKYERRE